MRTPSWWSEARTPVAFLVAPVAVPLVAPWLFAPWLAEINLGLALAVSWFVGYVGAFALGLPIYRYLLARKLTAFWIAPLVGFVIGAIMWCATFALFGWTLNLPEALAGGGLVGALVGTILWLIARPDRQIQATA
jgi:hypothetical protein